MKTKTTRFNFALTDEIAELIKQIAEKTDLSYTAIIKQGVKLLAEKKEIKNEKG